MKRPHESSAPTQLLCGNQAACTFFALPESTVLLMSVCDGEPRLVALLLQLSVQRRADVWLWLADTGCATAPITWGERLARIDWHRNLLKSLSQQVPPHYLENNHACDHNHGMFRPILWAPCKHWARGTLYLGLHNCAYDLKSGASEESGDDNEEKEEISLGDFYDCCSLVAHECWWGATWQPVCCAIQSAFHWDFVASALLHRHNALTALYAQNARHIITHYKESKYYRKYLFTGPSYQGS